MWTAPYLYIGINKLLNILSNCDRVEWINYDAVYDNKSYKNRLGCQCISSGDRLNQTQHTPSCILVVYRNYSFLCWYKISFEGEKKNRLDTADSSELLPECENTNSTTMIYGTDSVLPQVIFRKLRANVSRRCTIISCKYFLFEFHRVNRFTFTGINTAKPKKKPPK